MKIFSLDNILPTGLTFFVLLFFPVFFSLDFLDPIQNTIQDFYITDFAFSKLRNDAGIKVDSNIILVNISTLNRKGIAQELEIISRYQPKVIGLDGFFRDRKKTDQDSALATAMAKIDNLVLVSKLTYNPATDDFDSLETSNPLFNQYATTGFANLIVDMEEQFRTVRSFTVREFYGRNYELFFALKVAGVFDSVATHKFISRNNDKEFVNFRRNTDKYITLDVKDLFEPGRDLSFIKDKIVLMGFLGPDIHSLVTEDVFFTPLNHQYVGKTFPDMYGVTVHANVISMVLDEEYINQLPQFISIILMVAIVFFNMVFFSFLRRHYETLYEPVSIIMVFANIFGVFLIIITIFQLFRFDINIREIIFALFLLIPSYEGYNDSLKPLFIRNYNKIFKKNKKSEIEIEKDI